MLDLLIVYLQMHFKHSLNLWQWPHIMMKYAENIIEAIMSKVFYPSIDVHKNNKLTRSLSD